jgi:FkbM family methyltransferase
MADPLPFQLDLKDPLSIWRAESFWTKEFETIEWLGYFSTFQNCSIETFVDVGANIGIYSLYWLSLRDSSKAISCEPSGENIGVLRKNFRLNGYVNRVQIVEDPLYSNLAEGQLHVPDHRPGSSGTQFSSTIESTLSEAGRVKATILDEVIPDSSRAYILKIDVDGLDFEILKGGEASLESGCVKSVLIEATDKVQLEVSEFLQDFKFLADERFNGLEGHSDVRRKNNNKQERNRVYSLTSTF